MNEKTSLEQAIAADRQAARYENEARAGRPESDRFASRYRLTAAELMAVDPQTLELQSGELMHNPGNPDATCCNPLSEAPDQAAVQASLDRTNLTGKADCAGMALDAANSIGATNSLERMLAHQMAACHKVAFELIQEAGSVKLMDSNLTSIIQTRKINAASRMMQTFQQGMVALQKVRTGGKQTMVVQHVNVNDGGQAIVAGGNNGGGGGNK